MNNKSWAEKEDQGKMKKQKSQREAYVCPLNQVLFEFFFQRVEVKAGHNSAKKRLRKLWWEGAWRGVWRSLFLDLAKSGVWDQRAEKGSRVVGIVTKSSAVTLTLQDPQWVRGSLGGSAAAARSKTQQEKYHMAHMANKKPWKESWSLWWSVNLHPVTTGKEVEVLEFEFRLVHKNELADSKMLRIGTSAQTISAFLKVGKAVNTNVFVTHWEHMP